MTAAVYKRLAKTAARLIAKYGVPATITRTDDLGTITALQTRSVTTGTVKYALADSNINIGDDILLLDGSVTPLPGDRIAYGDSNRVLVNPVSPIKPADLVMAFECYARPG